MRAKSWGLLTIVGFCALLACGAARAEAIVGQPAPALSATLLDGEKIDLDALKGKVVIVHFWATWCPPCREEMPALEAVWRHYRGQGLEVLAISGDRPRARGEVEQLMHYFSFPAGMFGDLGKNDFGTPAVLPITYVVDKQGVVQNILTPDTVPLAEAGLGALVKTLLEAKGETKADVKPEAKSEPKP